MSELDTELQQSLTSLRFDEFALPTGLQRNINELGFQTCTEVQSQVLPYSLAQHDVCAQANTGTGKTAAFLTTLLVHCIEQTPEKPPQKGFPRALVLAPTRELALQITEDMKALSANTGVSSLAVVGGKKLKAQRDSLVNDLIDVVIATPGRLLDFMTQKVVDIGRVEILVIDEADRMLDMGFIPTVRRIVRHTPHRNQRQTMFFSATFNTEVKRLIEQWMFEPTFVEVESESIAADSIDQKFWMVSKSEKNKTLSRFFEESQPDRTLVFVNRRSEVKRVVKYLRNQKVKCEGLSGDMIQRQRTSTLNRFKQGKIQHIVATDVAGRGLHIEGISHVVNYDLPDIAEDYVHRIGRTGRAGAKGISISLVSELDGFVLPELEDLLDTKIICTTPDFEQVL